MLKQISLVRQQLAKTPTRWTVSRQGRQVEIFAHRFAVQTGLSGNSADSEPLLVKVVRLHKARITARIGIRARFALGLSLLNLSLDRRWLCWDSHQCSRQCL